MQIAVRGVPLSASDDDLKNHFRRYGQVLAVLEDEQEMPQDSDGKQACIFFADSASANQASASREKNNHIILGKLVEVSRFSIWLQHRRIKVYNLPPGTTSSQFRAYFEEFGTVTEAVVGPDGSGYVVFKWDESLRKVLKKKLHLFYGTELKARRESWGSEAFLVANAAQHESTSSATPCAHGVAYTPTRPAYTDSTCIATTPYDALYTPSYNRPTTVVPHAYSAPTPPFGTPYESSSDNRPISVTTYAYGAPSISPYGVPATSFYNSSTTATPHVDVNVPNDKKIFVGGLPTDITDDEFWAYFEKFGMITDAFVVKDKIDLVIDKNIYRPRGFGFVTFETKESANEVLKNQFHEMRPGKKVEVKKAIP
ncbi:Heterogeneous nuclear ribonucleoprotein 1 [Ananas comosus]|uniref:Heterogeneous nuclear ribonucleoprotein 1 n=1 Tax=Ananas comosus TaxID=4615 RepID=A0A199WA47_ANACO|nr:Heterogeneous nuclear ribonucleoprotein 1 [Ananas comosus]